MSVAGIGSGQGGHPSTRLPVALVERIRADADQRDGSSPSRSKSWLAEKVEGGRDRAGSKS